MLSLIFICLVNDLTSLTGSWISFVPVHSSFSVIKHRMLCMSIIKLTSWPCVQNILSSGCNTYMFAHRYVKLCLCLCHWPAGAHSITLVLEALPLQWKWSCKHWIRSMCQGTVCRWGRKRGNAGSQGWVGVTIPYWAEFISIQGQRHLAPCVVKICRDDDTQ